MGIDNAAEGATRIPIAQAFTCHLSPVEGVIEVCEVRWRSRTVSAHDRCAAQVRRVAKKTGMRLVVLAWYSS
jgi:hypothetical protein